MMGITATLAAQGLHPRKKFGQHFLTDPRILESIADAAEVTAADTVLEIGPGLGHLTHILARRAQRLVAVEVDAALAAHLQSEFANAANVRIVQGDFLTAAPHAWILGADVWSAPLFAPPPAEPGSAGAFKIVANLPYYITSAILRHVLEAPRKPQVIVAMVQREVAQRLTAQPPAMNLLAVSVQFFARARVIRHIAPGAFYPPPQVTSAVVRLDVYDPPLFADIAPAHFFEIVRAGFGEKRKQLHNALTHNLKVEAREIAATLARAQIDPTRRAETLTLAEWCALARALPNTPIVPKA